MAENVPDNDDTLHDLLDSEFCSINAVEQFLKMGISINALDCDNFTPLHHAVANKDCSIEVIKYLLDKGADVRIKSDDGRTPLHYLVQVFRKNGIDIVCLLLDHGLQLEELDRYGMTPLHNAVQTRYNKDLVAFLLDRGANIHAKSNRGLSALHFAVMATDFDYDIIKLLLKRGVNVHERDKNYSQPLHYAAENYSQRIVELLVYYGAKVNVANDCNKSPLYNSVHFDRGKGITEFLLDCGALVCCGESPLKQTIVRLRCGAREQVKLLLKYVLLENAVLNMEDKYSSSGLPEEFVDYKTECLREIHAMQQILIDKTTLLQLIFQWRQELPQRKGKVDIIWILNTFLHHFGTGAFPIYNEVMIGLIKRKDIEVFLGNQVLYAVSNQLDPLSSCQDPIMLPSNVLLILTGYISKVDLLNLVLAYYNSPKCGSALKLKRSLSDDKAPHFSKRKSQIDKM